MMMKVEGNINCGMVNFYRESASNGTNKPHEGEQRLNRDTLSLSAAGKAESEERKQTAETNRSQTVSQLEYRSKVEKIKVDIEKGSYSVSNDLIVDAIIRHAAGERS